MATEWNLYMAKCRDLVVEEDDGKWQHKMDRAKEFWRTNWPELPNLSKLARYCFTVTASSAAAERVFSVFKHCLSLVQLQSNLEDLSTITIMSQYNR